MPKDNMVRLILVDDYMGDCYFLKTILEDKLQNFLPYTRLDVKMFQDGLEAIDYVQTSISEGAADLVIIDENMPRYSGTQIIELAKEKKIKTPFILLTGDTNTKVHLKASRAGAKHFILKCELHRNPDIEEIFFIQVADTVTSFKNLLALERVAVSDPLTGIANKRKFELTLEQELRVINRTDNASIGLSYIDVDFFKDINDKHGHQVGDNYLIQIAERLSGIIQRKNSDLVARVGGDEFVIIFTNPTERYIKDTLNYIYCNLTEKYHFGDVSINNPSISIGAVLYRSQNQREVFKEELVRVADLMMYAHKKSKSNSERQRYELGILNR